MIFEMVIPRTINQPILVKHLYKIILLVSRENYLILLSSFYASHT